jgi:uncharacterized peroxidase-related enzyme
MFLKTIAEKDATGKVAEIYAAQKAKQGIVMEAIQCLTVRPDLLPAYMEFYKKILDGFTLTMREWRLITLIAAKHIPSTYCSHVYSRQLVEHLGSKEAVLAVQRDFRNAGLPARDVEMLAYAEKITKDASQVTQADIDRLRAAGFSDPQIADIALCAGFRNFVSRYFDATGAGTEAAFIDADEQFRAAMNVGRKV